MLLFWFVTLGGLVGSVTDSMVARRLSPFTITGALMAIYCRRQLYCGLRFVIWFVFLRSLSLLPACKKAVVRLGASGITAK
jgi:hypothetical protein